MQDNDSSASQSTQDNSDDLNLSQNSSEDMHPALVDLLKSTPHEEIANAPIPDDLKKQLLSKKSDLESNSKDVSINTPDQSTQPQPDSVDTVLNNNSSSPDTPNSESQLFPPTSERDQFYNDKVNELNQNPLLAFDQPTIKNIALQETNNNFQEQQNKIDSQSKDLNSSLNDVNNQIKEYQNSGVTPPTDLIQQQQGLQQQLSSLSNQASPLTPKVTDISNVQGVFKKTLQQQASDDQTQAAIAQQQAATQNANNSLANSTAQVYNEEAKRDQSVLSAKDEQIQKQQADDQANFAQQQDVTNRYNSNVSDLKDAIVSMAQEKIDPEAYWDNHSKTGASIGIILGGLAQGLMHTNNNQAFDALQSQIHLNVETQVNNMYNKRMLLNDYIGLNQSSYSSQYQMLALKQTMLANEFNSTSQKIALQAQSMTPGLAQAKALQYKSMLDAQSAQAKQVSTNAVIHASNLQSILQNGASPALTNQLSKEELGRLINIPGVATGFTNTAKGQDAVSKQAQTTADIKNAYNILMPYLQGNKTWSALLPSEEKGKVSAAAATLIGPKREEIFGSKFNTVEFKYMQSHLGTDPSKWLAVNSTMRGTLQGIKDEAQQKLETLANTYGGNNIKIWDKKTPTTKRINQTNAASQ
jgi:hypothetical protein